MNSNTGKGISDAEHIRQSIQDILTTPRGSRVMRRDYGSDLFELIDQPHTPALRLQLMAAIVAAIHQWEPRITVRMLHFESPKQTGRLTIQITADRIDGERSTLSESYKVTL